jgi:hypothetical protein
MKRSFEESHSSSQDLAVRRVLARKTIQEDSSLVYILPEDCFTIILNVLLVQSPDIYSPLNTLEIYENVLKFVCIKMHYICHKNMSHYYSTTKYEPRQKKEIDPFDMLKCFLIRKENDPSKARISWRQSRHDPSEAWTSSRLCLDDLANWFIDLEKFPKVSNDFYDFDDIWKYAAFSGNKKTLTWCVAGFAGVEWFSSAIQGAVEGNQIDILNWSLDHPLRGWSVSRTIKRMRMTIVWMEKLCLS